VKKVSFLKSNFTHVYVASKIASFVSNFIFLSLCSLKISLRFMVNVSGDCCQEEPLQGIKRFVKITGIPNLEKFFQEARGRRGTGYKDFYQEMQKTKRVEARKKLIKTCKRTRSISKKAKLFWTSRKAKKKAG